jgi:hypothetical protein
MRTSLKYYVDRCVPVFSTKQTMCVLQVRLVVDQTKRRERLKRDAARTYAELIFARLDEDPEAAAVKLEEEARQREEMYAAAAFLDGK